MRLAIHTWFFFPLNSLCAFGEAKYSCVLGSKSLNSLRASGEASHPHLVFFFCSTPCAHSERLVMHTWFSFPREPAAFPGSSCSGTWIEASQRFLRSSYTSAPENSCSSTASEASQCLVRTVPPQQLHERTRELLQQHCERG